MKKLHVNRPTIGNALIWAAMMIAAALLMRGAENTGMLILLMTIGWFTSNGLIDADVAPGRCAGKAGG